MEPFLLTVNDIFAKEDVTSADQRPECQQEAQEEPYPGPADPQAARGVRLSPQLTIGHRVHPERRKAILAAVFGQVPEKRYLSTSTKYSPKKVS